MIVLHQRYTQIKMNKTYLSSFYFNMGHLFSYQQTGKCQILGGVFNPNPFKLKNSSAQPHPGFFVIGLWKLLMPLPCCWVTLFWCFTIFVAHSHCKLCPP